MFYITVHHFLARVQIPTCTHLWKISARKHNICAIIGYFPTASNMGGVWEWQIRSARSIFAALLKEHGESLNDELLRTILVEVEAIINSRCISCDNVGDVNSIVPLNPMQLLSMKTKICHANTWNIPKGRYVLSKIMATSSTCM